MFATTAIRSGLSIAQASNENTPLEVLITAPLIETRWQDSPSGVTLIDDDDIGGGRAPLQATDALSLAPGVLVQNRNNFAQNPRVSIRGFGARAPFGIRGVRVRLDGIPLTTVDGQSQVDAIDPGTIKIVEVLRGANAVLHGNGSGGLLDYQSYLPGSTPFARVETQLGGFGLRRVHGALSQQFDQFSYRGAVTHLEQDGYREQSAVERLNAGLRLNVQQGSRDWFAILNHLDNPLAEDPGGLTSEEVQSDPSQAAPLAKAMNAGQQVRQNIASLGLEQRYGAANHRLRAQTWLTERDFRQQLPFPGDSLVSYDRQIIGGALNYQRPLGEFMLHTQLSLESQQDDRQRYCRNIDLEPFICRSGINSDLALDQRETARNAGLGLQLAGPVAQQQG
ncbi:MAG: TonB-dependent receptor plug domain-containing protein, partial [Gammaproteobacteria bacterium]|nr:TonB-dependent receptor plug domain-containing protein [Gammaproteobacteria bacterium]